LNDSPGHSGPEGSNGPHRCSLDIEVRYAETDRMGVVHHAVYLVWFEQVRTRICLEIGHHYAEIEEMGYYLVVTGSRLRYLAGAAYGDTVTVSCWIEKLSSWGMHFAYEVRRGEQRLASGSTEHVWVGRSSGRPCRIPGELRAAFERLAGRTPLRAHALG
jgi:acyl-CoA thioester hydrolase